MPTKRLRLSAALSHCIWPSQQSAGAMALGGPIQRRSKRSYADLPLAFLGGEAGIL